MSTKIITGYTGERHITPAMDAAVNRGIFGEGSYILATGNQMAANMPNNNTINIADGAFSHQGRLAQTTGETLTVDNCATGMYRTDLVVARFTHDSETLVDDIEIILLKGTETSSQYPTTPTYHEGSIADGTTPVDFLLYKLSLSGATVTVKRLAEVASAGLADIANPVGGQWKDARVNAGIKIEDKNSASNWVPAMDMKTANYDFSVGVYGDAFYVSAVSDTDYANGTNNRKYFSFSPTNGLITQGMPVGNYRVLWTGSWYMSGSQTINLSSNVSAQTNGIVLCWSAYSNGEAKNYDWVYQFIPKWHGSTHSANGVSCMMATVDFGKIGSKYVYVYNNKITGYASNTATGTRNGITYANNYWVLRAVLGI